MKIQNLAVIFIIIILPISMILTVYVQNQVKTLNLQLSYDTKLNNATYDALKAFQLNTINNDTSDIANSKLRDIEASVNTFFNSVSSNFNMAGYNQDILKEYVPALVYTMYDGYYIYSPFTNQLDTTKNNIIEDENGYTTSKSDAEILNQSNENATYKQGEKISGLKPYVYYSCRYVRGNDDFVITYSLDNYITIQGLINNESVFDYGYLSDGIFFYGQNTAAPIKNQSVVYRGTTIEKEYLRENLPDINGDIKEYKYRKINGVKYYKDEYNDYGKNGMWFSILGEERQYTNEKFIEESDDAIKYYRNAYIFTQKVLNENYVDENGETQRGYNLSNLRGSNAKDEKNDSIQELGDYLIFDKENIEYPNSNFNQQRLAVIKYSIEKNLSIAIANYNNYSSETKSDFRMPKLKEDEWDKILNNVSIISFLQGLNIGGKVYNGYSIITNNKNKEVVNEDSIYMLDSDGVYHKPNEKTLIDKTIKNSERPKIIEGVLNIDLEIKSMTVQQNNNSIIKYFIPKGNSQKPITGSYSSIVTQTDVNDVENFYEYIKPGDSGILANKYFTALGRERYNMYKTNNNIQKIKEEVYQK